MERGLVTNLILRKTITTTAARAKSVTPQLNHLLHLALAHGKSTDQNKRLNLYRTMLAKVEHPAAADELIHTISKRLNRPTVLLRKLGSRHGDGAAMTQVTIDLIKEPDAKPRGKK